MCTLYVKIKFVKIIFGTSLCYNRKKILVNARGARQRNYEL